MCDVILLNSEYYQIVGFVCPLPSTGKFWRQRFGKKRQEVFYSKVVQSGRRAGSCLRGHPLQNTQRKTQPSPARPVQGCTQSSCSHSKYPPLGIASGCCTIIQAGQLSHHCRASGFFLEPGYGVGMATSPPPLPVPGIQGCCQPLWPAMQGLHRASHGAWCLVLATWIPGPASPAKHRPTQLCLLVPGEEEHVFPSLHFNLLAQASTSSRRVQLPRQSRPFCRLD